MRPAAGSTSQTPRASVRRMSHDSGRSTARTPSSTGTARHRHPARHPPPTSPSPTIRQRPSSFKPRIVSRFLSWIRERTRWRRRTLVGGDSCPPCRASPSSGLLRRSAAARAMFWWRSVRRLARAATKSAKTCGCVLRSQGLPTVSSRAGFARSRWRTLATRQRARFDHARITGSSMDGRVRVSNCSRRAYGTIGFSARLSARRATNRRSVRIDAMERRRAGWPH